MVPQEVIDNAQQAVNNITNNAFTPAELKVITEAVIGTISVKPWADATLKDAMKFADIDPEQLPMLLTKDQAKSLDNIFKSLGNETLSPELKNLLDKARKEYDKARKSGRCRVE